MKRSEKVIDTPGARSFHGKHSGYTGDVPRGTIPSDNSDSLDEVRRLLLRGLGEIPFTVSGVQIELLSELCLFLHTWSQRINLTGHRAPTSIVRGLILDAAALLAVLPQSSAFTDLGSGAGFPGLPVAILRPEAAVLLIESRRRRHDFQRAAIRRLALANATARRGRIESLEPVASPMVIAQAVGPPRQVLHWMLPWVEIGGVLVIPGGAEPPDPGLDRRVGEPRVLDYRVPLGGPRRTVWTARRSS